MTNVEKLKIVGFLGEVRQRLNAKDAEDESRDIRINSMDNSELIATYCGWILGDKSWWIDLKYKFDYLEKLDNQ